MKHIKTWQERVNAGDSTFAKATALEAEVAELRAFIDRMCGLSPNWPGRRTDSLEGWINELRTLADHPHVHSVWLKQAMFTITNGLTLYSEL